MCLGSRKLLVCSAVILLVGTALPAMGEDPYHTLAFDGVNDYVAIADPIQVTDGPLTIEAWVWVVSTVGGRVVSNRHSANGYELIVSEASPSGFQVWFIVNGGVQAEGTVSQPLGQWVHIAVSHQGAAGSKIYANGVEIGSFPFAPAIAPTDGGLAIGRMGVGGWNFNGLIDEVRIWSTALSGDTIQAWMEQPLSHDHPNFANLEGYWKFDEGVGQVAASSLVHSPDRDGQLGSTAAVEDSDPAWSANVSPVPIEPVTFGRLKWGFR